MKSRLLKVLTVVMLAGVAMLTSCYPDDDITYDQTDVVITTKDDTVDFNKIHTYYLPDEVFVIDTTGETGEVKYKDIILGEIAQHLNDYGYQRVMDTTNASDSIDVVVIASVVENTLTSIWYPYYPYYPGWDWWWGSPGWGYYPPGWGYYPPGYYPPYYPGYPYITQYTTGTLMIDMIDPWKPQEHVEEGDTVVTYPNYWEATIHGLLEGNNIESRIKKSIDQAFEQSKYLEHK